MNATTIMSAGEHRAIKNKVKFSSLTPHKKKDGSPPQPGGQKKLDKPCKFTEGECPYLKKGCCLFMHLKIPEIEMEKKEEVVEEVKVEEPYKFGIQLGNCWMYYEDGDVHMSGREIKVSGTAVCRNKSEYVIGDGPLLFISNTYLNEFHSFKKFFMVKREVNYILPLFNILVDKFSISSNEARNYDSIMRWLVQKYSYLSSELIMGTLLVYCNHVRKLNPGDIVMSLVDATESARFTDSPFNAGCVMVLPTSIATFKNDWSFNNRWFLAGSSPNSTFDFKFDKRGSGAIYTYPSFREGSYDVDRPKYKLFAMCRFVGLRPSEHFEECNENIPSASSRQFKAPVNALEMYTNQMSLGIAVEKEFREVLSMCGAKIEDTRHLDPTHPFLVSSKPMWKLPVDQITHKNAKFRYRCHLPGLDYRMQVMIERLGAYLQSKAWKEMFLWKVLQLGYMAFDWVLRKYLEPFYGIILNMVFDPMYQFYDRLTWLSSVVQLPSPKRKLYQYFYGDVKCMESLETGDLGWTLKIKKEAGKYGKAPRFYGDIQHGTLVDSVCPSILKFVFEREIDLSHLFPNGKGIKYIVAFANAQDKKSSDTLFGECKTQK